MTADGYCGGGFGGGEGGDFGPHLEGGEGGEGGVRGVRSVNLGINAFFNYLVGDFSGTNQRQVTVLISSTLSGQFLGLVLLSLLPGGAVGCLLGFLLRFGGSFFGGFFGILGVGGLVGVAFYLDFFLGTEVFSELRGGGEGGGGKG